MGIVKKRRGYYYEWRLSGSKKEAVGKSKLSRSLHTDSRSEAERVAILVKAQMQREIDAALGVHPDELSRQFSSWRHLIGSAKTEEDRELTEGVLLDVLETRDRRAAKRYGLDREEEDAVRSTKDHEFHVRGYKYATGQLIHLTEHLEAYLARLQVEKKSVDQYRAGIKRIAEDLPFVTDVTPSSIQSFADKRLAEGAALKTIRRELSGARGYWNWLTQRLDVIDENKRSPFTGVNLPKQSTKAPPEREAYSARDAVALLRAAIAKPDPALADLIRLGMFTGARIEELCALKTEAVCLEDNVLKIRDAKTRAGNRDTPIHPRLRPVVARLKTESADGYLLSGLKRERKYGKRSNAIGKRFGKLKTRQGFGPAHVFHSFRYTLNTLLLNAGVPDPIVKDIVGHEQEGMTRGVYYDPDMEDQEEARRLIQADALAKARYPALTDEDMR